MDIDSSIKTLETLANGVDPITGEGLPKTSPYNHPDVIRAIFSVIDAVKNPPKKAKPVKKTVQEKQTENIECGLPVNAGLPWSDDERSELHRDFAADMSIQDLAVKYGRSQGAISVELKKQGLVEEL